MLECQFRIFGLNLRAKVNNHRDPCLVFDQQGNQSQERYYHSLRRHK